MKTAPIKKKHPRAAFTLIEIMVVVAIIGLVAAMGVPSIFQTFRKEGMRKTLSDVQQLLSDARARAIFSGQTIRVIFYPAEKRMEMAGGLAEASPAPPEERSGNNSESTPRPVLSTAPGTVVLPDGVDIAMLDINMLDYGAAESAWVHFYPNGTCDELTLVLHSGDEWEKITLEFSTSLATVAPVIR